MESIKQLFATPEMSALMASLIASLPTMAFTLIMFAVKYIKLKAKEIKDKATSEEVIQTLTAEYEAKIEKLEARIAAKLDSVEAHVTAKAAELEVAKEEYITQETEKLNSTLEEAKRAIM